MAASKKLLIRLSSAGDVLLTSPLLKTIKTREPEAEVHFVVKAQYADLIQNNPNVSKVHLVQNDAALHQLDNLRRQLLQEHFDTTLDLHNNFRSIYLRKGTAKKIEVIRKEVFKRALLVKTKLNVFSNVRSVALKYAQVYDKKIIAVPAPEIFFEKETKQKTADLWQKANLDSEKFIFLCPGAKHFTKRWPLEYWIELARKVSEGNHAVLIGGEGDSKICEAIARNVSVENFCGKLTLLESAAMLSYANVVITNDSFLMHAANAVGKKIVAIFGSTVREFGFFPYGVDNKIMEIAGLNCRPCSHVGLNHCPKKHFKCMMDTKPGAVYDAAMELTK
ncbi:MAG: glycosyltransferase family 9 protein [Candidatus Kryptoniota bacterium]